MEQWYTLSDFCLPYMYIIWCIHLACNKLIIILISFHKIDIYWNQYNEREIKFIGLFGDRGHRGQYNGINIGIKEITIKLLCNNKQIVQNNLKPWHFEYHLMKNQYHHESIPLYDTNFTTSLWVLNHNTMKIYIALYWKIAISPIQYLTYAMAGKLFWHLEDCNMTKPFEFNWKCNPLKQFELRC